MDMEKIIINNENRTQIIEDWLKSDYQLNYPATKDMWVRIEKDIQLQNLPEGTVLYKLNK